jgi:hypothetical protein
MPQGDPVSIAPIASAAGYGCETQKVEALCAETWLGFYAPRSLFACFRMNRNSKQLIRILALDLHPASFGYAVFENADLLDWGLGKCRVRDSTSLRRKLSGLIERWQPTRLLIREGAPRWEYRTVQVAARQAKVPLSELGREAVHEAFQTGKRSSRFDVAERVVARYPVLAPRLPSRRKLGYGEPFQVRMFNAISTAIAFRRRLLHSDGHFPK